MKNNRGQVVLKGIPISSGIAIGVPFFLSIQEDKFEELDILEKDVEKEIKRYRVALKLSKLDIENLKKSLIKEDRSVVVEILSTHLEMLSDPLITEMVEDKIRALKKNSESIFHLVVNEYIKQLENSNDPFFKERIKDINDVSKRILRKLHSNRKKRITQAPTNSIILANELIPTDTVEADSKKITAFVTQVGGHTSHSAIIARAKKIPFVSKIDTKVLKQTTFGSVIVDGNKGLVIINPNNETLEKYKSLKKAEIQRKIVLSQDKKTKAITKDSIKINILGNVEFLKDINDVLDVDADGIGLFRSEYLFLLEKKLPDENKQFFIYSQLAKQLKPKPITIRLFDIGADKHLIFSFEDLHNFDSNYYHEMNPALGCRGIRFLLRNEEILRAQLRAILRASKYGNIKILIPVVTDISEVREVRRIFQEERENLVEKGVIVSDNIQIGSMIEVPSTAILSNIFAKESDFLSIGTNDLSQYLLAADRNNYNMSYLYNQFHPSLFILLKQIITSANFHKKHVSICGEIAADIRFTKLLIGLGIRNFSISPNNILPIKEEITKIVSKNAEKLAKAALNLSTSQELIELLDSDISDN